ncbi:hypothetical protein [Asanoa sp. NPDC050611]|uniref:hypothetical protein n=1 Tax=Asanoa sp. NPDC050611 TaxID=3157098 RepID=UPI0033FE0B8A
MGGAVLATFAGAVVVGWSMGWFAERFRRARVDVRATKKGLPVLQKAMWTNFRKVAGRIVIVVALFAAALYGWANSQS